MPVGEFACAMCARDFTPGVCRHRPADWRNAINLREMLKRFAASGLTWPLGEDVTDTVLETRMYRNAGKKQGVLSGWQPGPGYGSRFRMTTSSNPYRGFRHPAEVIQHAVWLYHCFSLSLREVELILAARGVVVSYESIRTWGLRFGRMFANTLKRRRPRLGDKWHMDEVFIRIQSRLHYLWRAIDQDGNVLDILVQSRRSAKAAKRFFRKLLKGLQYVPQVIVTDKLKSSGAAKRVILPEVEHRKSRYLNNRIEVSHQPTRRRERHMKQFKSPRHAQQFRSSHSRIYNHFQLRRHRLSAAEYHVARDAGFATWRSVTGTAAAA